MTHRIENMFQSPAQPKYAGLTVVNQRGDRHFNGKVRCHDDVLETPLRWKKPRRIFVNSMSDLFHKDVPFEFIDKVFAVMALCPQHTFQVLTKRPERMAEYTCQLKAGERFVCNAAAFELPEKPQRLAGVIVGKVLGENEGMLPNVWLGCSVENQETADERIPHLLRCPAAVRFLSVEPMLGPVTFTDQLMGQWRRDQSTYFSPVPGSTYQPMIHWVIVGGESGPGSRPMYPNWVRAVRDQCAHAGVPFFFKQWGDWLPAGQDGVSKYGELHLNCSDEPVRVGKAWAGARLDGVEHREFPKVEAVGCS
jgi:protein gp37